MAKKTIKVLYFIQGAVASADDEEAISKFSAKHVVCFRNVEHIHEGDHIEPFDVVAGAVPADYKRAAKEKKPEAERPAPKTAAASVPVGSPVTPLTPPEGDQGASVGTGEGNGAETGSSGSSGSSSGSGDAGTGSSDQGQQPPADPPADPAAAAATGAKPKPPKAGAAAAWTPNA